jgi:outer membrane protein
MLRPLFFMALLGNTALQAQTALDLRGCVEQAWQNNLLIQRSELSLAQAQLNQKQARWAQYPMVSGSLRHGLNVGRSVDLTTYQFVNQAMQSTNISLNASVPIYNGLQLRNNIQLRNVEVAASEKDLEQTKNDLALSVAQAYLSVLLAEENLGILQSQRQVTQAQYEQSLKLIAAGSLPENNRFDLEAQLAQQDQNIVNAENSIQMAYLSLKQLLNMDANKPLKISPINLGELPKLEELNDEEIYTEAAQQMPNLKAAQLRERSAELNVQVAKGALQPSIALFSSLATNYSSVGQRYTGDTITVFQQFSGDLGGTPFTLSIPTRIPGRERNPYFNQLGDNFTQAIGINIQVPIYNGGQARLNIERANLSVRLARINTQQLQVQLKADIQRAVADARAAARRLQAAERSLKSTQIAADNSSKRYSVGTINAFEYNSVQNSLTVAKSNYLQAQYDYVFRLKILDYYRGKGVQ